MQEVSQKSCIVYLNIKRSKLIPIYRNALLAVILPNKAGKYDYFDKDTTFPILKSNIENGYAYVVTWEDFLKYPQIDMDIAFGHKDETPSYKIVKTV